MTDEAQRADRIQRANQFDEERKATLAKLEELRERLQSSPVLSFPNTVVINIGFTLEERDLIISALWTYAGEL